MLSGLLLNFANTHAGEPPPVERRLTDAQWREDLDTVVALLEAHHPNPCYLVGRDRIAALTGPAKGGD